MAIRRNKPACKWNGCGAPAKYVGYPAVVLEPLSEKTNKPLSRKRKTWKSMRCQPGEEMLLCEHCAAIFINKV